MLIILIRNVRGKGRFKVILRVFFFVLGNYKGKVGINRDGDDNQRNGFVAASRSAVLSILSGVVY